MRGSRRSERTDAGMGLGQRLMEDGRTGSSEGRAYRASATCFQRAWEKSDSVGDGWNSGEGQTGQGKGPWLGVQGYDALVGGGGGRSRSSAGGSSGGRRGGAIHLAGRCCCLHCVSRCPVLSGFLFCWLLIFYVY
jgi:hypothetical protein